MSEVAACDPALILTPHTPLSCRSDDSILSKGIAPIVQISCS